MTKGERGALTRLNNKLTEARQKQAANPSPYLIEKVLKAKRKLKNKLDKMVKKYGGAQTSFLNQLNQNL